MKSTKTAAVIPAQHHAQESTPFPQAVISDPPRPRTTPTAADYAETATALRQQANKFSRIAKQMSTASA